MIAHLAFPKVTLATLDAELRRELQQRRRFFPGRVKEGRMSQQEADAQLGMVGAWLEDVGRMHARWVEQRRELGKPAHGMTWNARRAGILREIDYRERFYPQWVKDGRILEDEAAHRIACLFCLLEIYEDGWDFVASNGRRGNSVLAVNDREEAAAVAEYRAVLAENAARKGTAQKALAL